MVKHIFYLFCISISVQLAEPTDPIQNPVKPEMKVERIAKVITYSNDSLSLPDSLMTAYTRLLWETDSIGEKPKYYDILPNGCLITWTEAYTDGQFYIKLYRNYIVAGVHHDNPNPNLVFSFQAITGAQFEQISALLLGNQLQETVVKSVSRLYGKSVIHFKLNEKQLGLYSYGDVFSEDPAMNKKSKLIQLNDSLANQQLRKGYLGFIKSINKHLKKKLRVPLLEPEQLSYRNSIVNGIFFFYPIYSDCSG